MTLMWGVATATALGSDTHAFQLSRACSSSRNALHILQCPRHIVPPHRIAISVAPTLSPGASRRHIGSQPPHPAARPRMAPRSPTAPPGAVNRFRALTNPPAPSSRGPLPCARPAASHATAYAAFLPCRLRSRCVFLARAAQPPAAGTPAQWQCCVRCDPPSPPSPPRELLAYKPPPYPWR